ncbi:hypothetical protein GCM10010251_15570 [Streptomyces aurantiogriseus]|uniref:Uncharacterized protein n=1 Tax=Streptomyces aurantiogriseus TaxID=66870 RepID=A0A918C1H2_9ACTN|nr:hypothetical protein GCM10010251_15570 [Streptomyces aurantiogriseus]
MAEAGLVGGVGRVEGRVGRSVRVGRQGGERLARQGFHQVTGGQVVGRLVGRGEEGVDGGVGAVGRDALGPVVAAEAGEEGAVGRFGGCPVERLQRGRRGPGLLRERRYGGSARKVGETVRRQRGILASRVVWQGMR